MSSLPLTGLKDSVARQEALDTGKSILVHAPAGSGKTELLTMRFLKLLAEVEQPEEILAITFTKAATAEMRHRILIKLEEAKRPEEGETNAENEISSLALARSALANSDRRGWRLLEQPHRLNIQTIDSLCLRIARQRPLAARLGGALEPTEWGEPLYRSAARKTLDRLGGGDPELDRAIETLLLLRDSNLADCETLLAGMLSTRDQWGDALPLTGEVDWKSVRATMEAPFQRERQRVLGRAHDLFSSHPELTAELLVLANYACQAEDLKIDILALSGRTSLPDATSAQAWNCIANLLLQQSKGEWLIHANTRHGFPAGSSYEAEQKERRKSLIAELERIPGLLDLLSAIRKLPPAHYSDEEWETLRHMFTTLRQAVSDLDGVFAEKGVIDFVELGRSARSGDAEDVRHLLVDEFQDTSRRQYELISSLISGWGDTAGSTVFLVGDPMQSIYLFRQADVELFDRVREDGIAVAGGRRPVRTVALRTNFRSTAGIVNPINQIFEKVFPHKRKEAAAGVDFLAGVANNLGSAAGAFQVHTSFIDLRKSTIHGASATVNQASLVSAAQRRETEEILQIVRQHLRRLEQARLENREFTVAVLARAKEHLTAITAALRREAIPFRAVELETLGERQEVLDLQSVTRALFHPMDRIAWLAILRAPWCGLTLYDLHRLCGTDDRSHASRSILKQIEERLHLLGEDAKQRVVRLTSVMSAAQRHRYSQASFSSWVERTWTSLGGPECVDATGYENALAYFAMLDEITPDGIAATGEEMGELLNRLFAKPDPSVSERCGVQLMTIHKAKGLGFNVVVVPGLQKKAGQDGQSLIRYLERTNATGAEMVAAPIGLKGEKSSPPLYSWVGRQKKDREAEERKRLLYVACTRAREELHLFGTAAVTNSGLNPTPGSLLATGWPALEPTFSQAHNRNPVSNLLHLSTGGSAEQPAAGRIDLAVAADSPRLQRLPSDWAPAVRGKNVTDTVTVATLHPAAALHAPVGLRGGLPPPDRPQASRAHRALGMAVHALLEQAARLMQQGLLPTDLHPRLAHFQKQATMFARNQGLSRQEAEVCATEAVAALKSAIQHDLGLWILKPHPQAQTESSWTGILDGALRTLRIDRSFVGGRELLSDGGDTLWIIDYKTATHGQAGLEQFLASELLQYREQLEGYGRMMRLVQGPELNLRLGLYYPLLQRLEFWPG